MNQKLLHPDFGVEIDFSEIKNTSYVIDLIKQHSLVVLNASPCTNTKEDFLNFAKSFGHILPKVIRESTSEKLSMIYLSDEIGVDDFVYNFDNNTNCYDQKWHQDGPDYYHNPVLGISTVKISNGNINTKTADTLFLSSQGLYNSFSEDFKLFLKKITQVQTSSGLNNKGRWIEHVLMNNLKNKDFSALMQQILKLKQKLGNRVTKPLVAISQWGFEYLDYNPSSDVTFNELTEVESKFLTNFLLEQINNFNYCYYHQWQPNQIVLYDNQRLLHRFLNNATSPHTRNFWRLQVDITTIGSDK